MTYTVLFGINTEILKKKPFLNNGRQSKAAVFAFSGSEPA